MKSDAIYEAIEKIAATASKTEKQNLVSAFGVDPEFMQVLKAALDPTITYGIYKVPSATVAGTRQFRQFSAATWAMLDALRKRELTGKAALKAVQEHMGELTPDSAELLKRIIIKDLKAGFSGSTVNKGFKGAIPNFPYMRCSLPEEAKPEQFDWKAGVYSQEKADGMFANLTFQEGGHVTITSRQGAEFPLDEFRTIEGVAKLCLPENVQVHGEFVVYEHGLPLEREISNGIMNSVVAGGSLSNAQAIHYLVWDMVPFADVTPKGRSSVVYAKRLQDLGAALAGAPAGSPFRVIDTRKVFSLDEAYTHFREMLAVGKEGTIYKDPGMLWEDRTSKWQVKLKVKCDVDLRITGIVPGQENGKNAGRAGSLTMETSDGQLRVDVAVKNEKMRNEVDANPQDWLGKIAVVRFNSIMKPSETNPLYSLFLPRMVEASYRIDKSEADSLARVRDQFKAATAAA